MAGDGWCGARGFRRQLRKRHASREDGRLKEEPEFSSANDSERGGGRGRGGASAQNDNEKRAAGLVMRGWNLKYEGSRSSL